MPAREARRQEAAGAALAGVVVEDDVDEAGVVPEEDADDEEVVLDAALAPSADPALAPSDLAGTDDDVEPERASLR